MRPVQRKRIYEHVRLLMAAIMCCGLLKILCIMCVCVCVCVCFIFVSGLTHTRFGPVRVSPSHSRPQCLIFLCFSVYGMQQQRLTGIQLPTVKWLYFSNQPSSTQHHVHFWQQINVSRSGAEIRVWGRHMLFTTVWQHATENSEHFSSIATWKKFIQPKQCAKTTLNTLATCKKTC